MGACSSKGKNDVVLTHKETAEPATISEEKVIVEVTETQETAPTAAPEAEPPKDVDPKAEKPDVSLPISPAKSAAAEADEDGDEAGPLAAIGTFLSETTKKIVENFTPRMPLAPAASEPMMMTTTVGGTPEAVDATAGPAPAEDKPTATAPAATAPAAAAPAAAAPAAAAPAAAAPAAVAPAAAAPAVTAPSSAPAVDGDADPWLRSAEALSASLSAPATAAAAEPAAAPAATVTKPVSAAAPAPAAEVVA